MDSGTGPIGSLIVGIMMIVLGVLELINDTPDITPRLNSGILVPRPPLVDFVGLLLIPIGIAIVVMSIIAIRRGEGKPKKYTEEDAVKAKAAMDRMYFREHGRWPEEESKKDA